MPEKDQRTNKTTSMMDIARQFGVNAHQPPIAEPSYTCEACHDLGYITPDVPLDHPKRGTLLPCPACELGQENKRQILIRKFKQTQLPSNYANAHLEDWFQNLSPEQRQGKYLAYFFAGTFAASGGLVSVHDALSRFWAAKIFKTLPDFLTAQLNQPDKLRYGLVLQGAVGIGKTWLAAAALNAMRDKHHVIFARSGDMLEAAISTWGTTEKQTDVLEAYRSAEILFLDDVHIDTSNKLSSYHREIMTTLIRYRYDHRMPTMITCNSDKETFYEEWGKRLADAVMEMCHWIPMGGDKLRDTEQDWKAI